MKKIIQITFLLLIAVNCSNFLLAAKNKSTPGPKELKVNYLKKIIPLPPWRPLSQAISILHLKEVLSDYTSDMDLDDQKDREESITKLEKSLKKTSAKPNKIKLLKELVTLYEHSFVYYLPFFQVQLEQQSKNFEFVSNGLAQSLRKLYILTNTSSKSPFTLYKAALLHFFISDNNRAMKLSWRLVKKHLRSQLAMQIKEPMMAYYVQIDKISFYQKLFKSIKPAELDYFLFSPLFTFLSKSRPSLEDFKHILSWIPSLSSDALEKISRRIMIRTIDDKAHKIALKEGSLSFAKKYFLDKKPAKPHYYNDVLHSVGVTTFKKKNYSRAEYLFEILRKRIEKHEIAPAIQYQIISSALRIGRKQAINRYLELMRLYNPNSEWFLMYPKLGNYITHIRRDLLVYFDSLRNSKTHYYDYIRTIVAFLDTFQNVGNKIKVHHYTKVAKYFSEKRKFKTSAFYYVRARKFAPLKQWEQYTLWAIKDLEVATKIAFLRPEDIDSANVIPIESDRRLLIQLYDQLSQKRPKSPQAALGRMKSGIIIIQAGDIDESIKRLQGFIVNHQSPRFMKRCATIILSRLNQNVRWKDLRNVARLYIKRKVLPYNYTPRLLRRDYDTAVLRIIEGSDKEPPVQVKEIQNFLKKNPKSPAIEIAYKVAGDKYLAVEEFKKALYYYNLYTPYLPLASDERKDHLMLVSSLYESLFLLPQVANAYEQLFKEFNDTGTAKSGVLFAGEIREIQNNFTQANKNYTSYIEAFPEEPNVPDVKRRIAENLAKLNQAPAGLKLYQENIASIEDIAIKLDIQKHAARYAKKYEFIEESVNFYKEITKTSEDLIKNNMDLVAEAHYNIGYHIYQQFKKDLKNFNISEKGGFAKIEEKIKAATEHFMQAEVLNKNRKFAALSNLALYQMYHSLYIASLMSDLKNPKKHREFYKFEPSPDSEADVALDYKKKANFHIQKANAYYKDILLPFNMVMEIFYAAANTTGNKSIDQYLLPSHRVFHTNTLDLLPLAGLK